MYKRRAGHIGESPEVVVSVTDKIADTIPSAGRQRKDGGYIPSEKFHLQPISTDQHAIPQGKECAEVSTPPE